MIEIGVRPKIGFTVAAQDISDDELISSEDQDRLIHWREIFKTGFFDIGDISAGNIERAARRGIVISDERIDKAVGRFCGKTARTVRYYRETAVFFPKEVREEFDMLPFSHFVFARSLGETWRESLEWSSIHPDATVAMLRYQFILSGIEGGIGYAAEEDLDENPGMQSEMPIAEYGAPQKMCEVSQDIPARALSHVRLAVVHAFASALSGFVQLIEESDSLPDDVKRLLIDASETISRYLPEVVRSVV